MNVCDIESCMMPIRFVKWILGSHVYVTIFSSLPRFLCTFARQIEIENCAADSSPSTGGLADKRSRARPRSPRGKRRIPSAHSSDKNSKTALRDILNWNRWDTFGKRRAAANGDGMEGKPKRASRSLFMTHVVSLNALLLFDSNDPQLITKAFIKFLLNCRSRIYVNFSRCSLKNWKRLTRTSDQDLGINMILSFVRETVEPGLSGAEKRFLIDIQPRQWVEETQKMCSSGVSWKLTLRPNRMDFFSFERMADPNCNLIPATSTSRRTTGRTSRNKI